MVAAATERDGGAPAAGAAALFLPKKGSVFPAKRKLVKTMMFDLIVETFINCFRKVQPNRALEVNKNGTREEKKNNRHVFPLP